MATVRFPALPMAHSSRPVSRRRFLQNSAALAATAAVATKLPSAAPAASAAATDFASDWSACPDRVWLGEQFWANPLQDWELKGGRVLCTNAAADRNVHLLTRALGEQDGDFRMQVRLSRADNAALTGGHGTAGFRVGIRGQLPDYRNALLFGRGFDAGLTSDGGLFIGQLSDAKPGAAKLAGTEAMLRLEGVAGSDGYTLTLTVSEPQGRELGRVTKTLPRERCIGGVALVNNFGAAGAGGGGKAGKAKKAAAGGGSFGTFAFADWRVTGTKLVAHPERVFGPLLFSQYTLSGGILKLSVQLPPIGPRDAQTVQLQTRQGSDWKTIGEAPIHAEARMAAFRVPNWDASKDVPYRLRYTLLFTDGRKEERAWTGTIRHDPVEKPSLAVADISCNIHSAFPNAPYVAGVGKLDPDLLAFVGDQFYESSGGYGIIRTPTDKAMLDYLRKWYLHGWTWRELMRDRPSVSLPDDHDVYQGNLWGEGGRAQGATQETGGYTMPAEWVNVVYRSQTAHHPDPVETTPCERGTLQYFGPLTYGRVSFAILADRQYKSGPEGKVPPTGGRGDHESNPNYDPRTADVKGLSLLGEAQEKFLHDWVRDWRGAEMKAVISQTIFTGFPTTHGTEREVLRADYDANGWPQTPRNRAVREMRKAFAFHVAGDQHIPGLVQYGVDEHRDGPVAFAGPAVNVGYPRWFEPERAPWTKPRQAGLTGDFTDSFGHPMTVIAVRNGAVQPRQGDILQFLDDKSSGFGMVHFDKARRKIRIECWPLQADFTQPAAQWPGWPVEIDEVQNYGRKTTGHLPTLAISGVAQPVIEVSDEANGELVYVLRSPTNTFRPHVFGPGKFTVRVSEPETGKSTTLRGLAPATAAATLNVKL
jgi:alkaline phosphatase D